MARRYPGEDGGREFMALRGQTFSRWIRIAIRPEEVRILDLGAGKFPSAWSAPGRRGEACLAPTPRKSGPLYAEPGATAASRGRRGSTVCSKA